MPLPEFEKHMVDFNWEKLKSEYSWVRDMVGVPQSNIHHKEGSVDVHVELVMKSLLKNKWYQTCNHYHRMALFMGALMHDIEKRSTTKEEDGKIVSPGHAKKGEYTTRQILYRDIPTPFALREKIAKLVRHHGLPLWVFDKPNPQKSIIESSLVSDTFLLSIIAEADVDGRICEDADDLHYKIQLFKELSAENKCYASPRLFPSNLSRFLYFNKKILILIMHHMMTGNLMSQ